LSLTVNFWWGSSGLAVGHPVGHDALIGVHADGAERVSVLDGAGEEGDGDLRLSHWRVGAHAADLEPESTHDIAHLEGVALHADRRVVARLAEQVASVEHVELAVAVALLADGRERVLEWLVRVPERLRVQSQLDIRHRPLLSSRCSGSPCDHWVQS